MRGSVADSAPAGSCRPLRLVTASRTLVGHGRGGPDRALGAPLPPETPRWAALAPRTTGGLLGAPRGARPHPRGPRPRRGPWRLAALVDHVIERGLLRLQRRRPLTDRARPGRRVPRKAWSAPRLAPCRRARLGTRAAAEEVARPRSGSLLQGLHDLDGVYHDPTQHYEHHRRRLTLGAREPTACWVSPFELRGIGDQSSHRCVVASDC